jgi:hypothetical protein
MWKPEHRIAADRSGLRYPSDLTSAEWAIVEPMVPSESGMAAAAGALGWPEKLELQPGARFCIARTFIDQC